MAKKITDGIVSTGMKVSLFDVTQADRTELVKEMFESKGYLIGSSTHDNDMLPNIAGFLEFIKGLNAKNRSAAVFGSYGWAGGAVKEIEEIIQKSGIRITQPSLGIQYVPDEEGLKKCFEFGKFFAENI